MFVHEAEFAGVSRLSAMKTWRPSPDVQTFNQQRSGASTTPATRSYIRITANESTGIASPERNATCKNLEAEALHPGSGDLPRLIFVTERRLAQFEGLAIGEVANDAIGFDELAGIQHDPVEATKDENLVRCGSVGSGDSRHFNSP